MGRLRLGINIDHIATLRNARGGTHPNPLAALRLIGPAGGDGVTLHLREDRRHIRDADVEAVVEQSDLPVNLEMAATEEMVATASRLKPHAVCIVPERRQERTTEHGLDARGLHNHLAPLVGRLRDAGCRVSLFIDPQEEQLEVAADLGVPVVELHTGTYAETRGDAREAELERLRRGASLATSLGIECHAGHGLTYDNVAKVAAIPELRELNIGHFLIGQALFAGLVGSIQHMRLMMDQARQP
ncbi:MAG: pyridoxine 5'-phosphate synthase [Geminicoccaceae bacterium]